VIEWIASGLACIAGVAIVLWLRERQETRDLKVVVVTLGNEYDLVSNELAELRKTQPVQLLSVKEQTTRWLN
jgi:hypothetical protein